MDGARYKKYDMNIVDPIILLDSIETMEFDTLSESVPWWPRVFGFKSVDEKCNHLVAARGERSPTSPQLVWTHTEHNALSDSPSKS